MKKVLVIEDDEAIKNIILELLEAEGFGVMSAINGQMGIELAKTQAPDLIICDIMMPNFNGYSVLNALHLEPKTALIPFIFLTAKVERSEIRKGMNLGADDYVTKPFTRDELLEAVTVRLKKKDFLVDYYSTDIQSKEDGENTIDVNIINSTKEEIIEQFLLKKTQIMARMNTALHMLENCKTVEQYEHYSKIIQDEYKQEIKLINEFTELRSLLTPKNIKLLCQYNLIRE
ncbi:response regulator [Scytonema sp. UIC 10036]|uniref:response regulator transcription factor n=1 Tax=Scytonema sp. UIC 10036 TaxID=2304196 RepID=UPI0012DAADC5|nr:response regulator [Scytonema sp. UIC 10036]MUG99892.1 response regulator [Scytonema sp. UIC 10036]